jgi:hypothetical protein
MPIGLIFVFFFSMSKWSFKLKFDRVIVNIVTYVKKNIL